MLCYVVFPRRKTSYTHVYFQTFLRVTKSVVVQKFVVIQISITLVKRWEKVSGSVGNLKLSSLISYGTRQFIAG